MLRSMLNGLLRSGGAERVLHTTLRHNQPETRTGRSRGTTGRLASSNSILLGHFPFWRFLQSRLRIRIRNPSIFDKPVKVGNFEEETLVRIYAAAVFHQEAFRPFDWRLVRCRFFVQWHWGSSSMAGSRNGWPWLADSRRCSVARTGAIASPELAPLFLFLDLPLIPFFVLAFFLLEHTVCARVFNFCPSNEKVPRVYSNEHFFTFAGFCARFAGRCGRFCAPFPC